jgi:hypothetical protein
MLSAQSPRGHGLRWRTRRRELRHQGPSAMSRNVHPPPAAPHVAAKKWIGKLIEIEGLRPLARSLTVLLRVPSPNPFVDLRSTSVRACGRLW